MAMQTIPSRLTIWTSFKGLPTASPFFRAKRNDAAQFGCAVLTDAMTLRGVLTAQENFKAHGAAH